MPTDWRAEEAARIARKFQPVDPMPTFWLGPNTRAWIEKKMEGVHQAIQQAETAAATDARAAQAQEAGR